MKIRLGEPIFKSVQGEGNRTGVLSIWMRLFGCNLKCEGFYQKFPTKPDTWEIPKALSSGKEYKTLQEVPILHTGCDSGYSWHPNFKHLAIDMSIEDAVASITALLPSGVWTNVITRNDYDLCITGGEPMMQQPKIVELLHAFGTNLPNCIQIETNGTKFMVPKFADLVNLGKTINWNISPKLHNVSGERDAVNYLAIQSYYKLSEYGCLKFVVNESDATWNELDTHVRLLRTLYGVRFPVYVMPVGATYEQQTNVEVLSKIATRAVNEGYHVSGRLQAVLWGNGIGT